MSDLLAGKKVLITGSTHGIGKAYAGAMLKSGAQVVVNSFGSDPPPGLIDELSSLGPCHYVGANMAEIEGAQRAVSAAFGLLGGLDVLINNAGTHKDKAFLENTPEQFGQTFDLNVRGYYFAAQTFVKLTGKREFDASIICTGSINGLQAEFGSVLYDSSKGAVLMMVITLMIMGTSAAVLKGETLGGVGDVAAQLEPLFGKWGKGLFCLGLFSAAYSSFIVNSMIGGFILSDGLGLGSNPEDKWPKRLTIAVLLTGMIVALLIKQAGLNKLHAIVAAQAVTVVASPLVAGALLWLSNRKDVMGEDRNGPVANTFGSLGLAVLIAVAGYTAFKSIPDNIEKIKASQTVPAER